MTSAPPLCCSSAFSVMGSYDATSPDSHVVSTASVAGGGVRAEGCGGGVVTFLIHNARLDASSASAVVASCSTPTSTRDAHTNRHER